MLEPVRRATARVGEGLELLIRTGGAAAFLGLRWAGQVGDVGGESLPPAKDGPGLRAKVALDELFLASEVLTTCWNVLPDARRIGREIREGVELYQDRGWIDDPARFHQAPPELGRAVLEEHRHRGIDYRELSFESEYEPHADEPGRDRWLDYGPNRRAYARLLEHPGAPRPWLICVPGYRMGALAADFTAFKASWLHHDLGLNVAIPVLPLHGPRAVGRRGGDGFLSGDMLDTVHAQTQAVWDVRRLADWLRAQGAPAVGAYGVSLGGYTTALLVTLENDLDCVIAGVPAIDFLGLVRSHAPRFLMGAAERVGFDWQPLDRLVRVISPLAMPPRIAKERRYMFAGLADRLTWPEQARRLWEHWEQPRIDWYNGTHVSFLWETQVQQLLRDALSESGLVAHASHAAPTPPAPARAYA